MSEDSSRKATRLGPLVFGLLIGLLGVRMFVALAGATVSFVFALVFFSGTAALVTAYALVRGRSWWWRAYLALAGATLFSGTRDEILDGYGLEAGLLYIVFAGALLLAVGLYLRSALGGHSGPPNSEAGLS